MYLNKVSCTFLTFATTAFTPMSDEGRVKTIFCLAVGSSSLNDAELESGLVSVFGCGFGGDYGRFRGFLGFSFDCDFGFSLISKSRLNSRNLKISVVKEPRRTRKMRLRASKSPPTSPSQSSTLYTDRLCFMMSELIANDIVNRMPSVYNDSGTLITLFLFSAKNVYSLGEKSPQVSSSASKMFCSS